MIVGRIVIVSNRVAVPQKGDKSAGGLEVVIRATLKRHGGTWFGWSGAVAGPEGLQLRSAESDGISLTLTDLSREDFEEYYNGFANRVLWPILHYRIDLAEFSRRDLSGYLRVNERLANEVHALVQDDDLIWVHDYHLIPFARILRDLGLKNRIGFFLHVPFPPPEVVTALPNYRQLLLTMLDYDLVGFQTNVDASNFARFLAQENLLPNHISRGAHGNRMRIGTFPVGVDVSEFRDLAEEACKTPFIENIRASMRGPMIIGVDRLDYSKGLDLRLEAYEQFLNANPQWRAQATYIQVTPRSRSQIAEYAKMENNVRNAAGRINGRFGEGYWTPLRYVNRTHSRTELAGLYRSASVGLVTPLRDGMNLVAKEYIAAQNPDDPGVLVLSKFAGAAVEMGAALIVNPYDKEAVAGAIAEALAMPLAERRDRYNELMGALRRSDINLWGENFLSALRGAKVESGNNGRPTSERRLSTILEKFSTPIFHATGS
jgi:trehalose 6-phosphate synthase